MQTTQPQEETAWFCLISQRKHEHIAAAQLAEQQAVRVFAPRVRFRRPTRNGPRWTTEALFPSYFFARIAPSSLRRVHYAPQVRGIVHFGKAWPTIPEHTIEELEKTWGGEKIHSISTPISTGDKVEIIEGTLKGLQALVTQVMPASERVAILLDFLGRQTVVEINSQALMKNDELRGPLFKAA
jgi:transcriptional antiterminator RfaH